MVLRCLIQPVLFLANTLNALNNPTAMKKIPLLILVCILLAGLHACSSDDATTPEEEQEEEVEDPPALSGSFEYVLNIGGSDNDSAASIVPTNDGGYVFAGATQSTNGDVTDKTGDDRDVWVVKTNSSGAIQWSKTYGGSDDDEGTSISPTSDGGYIVSGFTRSDDGDVSTNAGFNDLWIIKLSATGELQWEKTFGYSGNDRAFNVKQTKDGGYLALGVLDVTASGGQGNINRASASHAGGDYWVLKLDPTGEINWARYYGGSFTDSAFDFVETDNGNYIITGWSDSSDVDITNNKGEYDFWILNISANGSINWKKNYGGTEIDLAYSMTTTTDGNFIIVGDTRSADTDISNFIGNADVWAIKIDSNGSIIWEKTYGGTQFDSARGVASLPNGRYAIVASSRSNDVNVTTNNGLNDGWFVVIDEEGTLLFEESIGGSQLDFAEGITSNATGEIYIVGNTESNDGNFTQNKGGKDAFLAKFKFEN